MFEIGRICIKLAGRDGGREAVIVDVLDKNFVTIDGNVRRRKCNISHLEPTKKTIDIKKGASHEEVKAEFEKLDFKVWETKPKQAKEKPKPVRNKKKLQRKEEEAKKPATKKKAAKVVKEAEVVEEKKTTVKKKAPAKKAAPKKPAEKKE